MYQESVFVLMLRLLLPIPGTATPAFSVNSEEVSCASVYDVAVKASVIMVTSVRTKVSIRITDTADTAKFLRILFLRIYDFK